MYVCMHAVENSKKKNALKMKIFLSWHFFNEKKRKETKPGTGVEVSPFSTRMTDQESNVLQKCHLQQMKIIT